MAIVNKAPSDTFQNLLKGAGMWALNFTPSAPPTLADEDILCTTSGGTSIKCTPVTKNLADGIDNLGENQYFEMKEIVGYTVEASFSTKTANNKMLKLGMGLANESGSKIVPKHGTLTKTDVQDLWFVTPQTDKKCFAACIKNAFSTGGLDMKTENNGTGTLNVTLTGMYSLETQDVVPLECYIIEDDTVMAAASTTTVKTEGNK